MASRQTRLLRNERYGSWLWEERIFFPRAPMVVEKALRRCTARRTVDEGGDSRPHFGACQQQYTLRHVRSLGEIQLGDTTLAPAEASVS